MKKPKYLPIYGLRFSGGGELPDEGSGSLGKWTKGIAGATGIIGSAIQMANPDTKSVENAVDRQVEDMKRQEGIHASSLDDLMNQWSNFHLIDTNFDVDDYYNGPKDSSIVTNTIGSAASGAATGAMVGGPWGAVVGGVIGLGSSLVGGLIGKDKANDAAKEAVRRLRAQAEETNAYNQASFGTLAKSLSQRNFRNQAANISAFGGPINILEPAHSAIGYMQNEELIDTLSEDNTKDKTMKTTFPLYAFGGALGGYGGDWTNGLTIIGNGGTHGQNPIGGVPMGISQDGMPNLVEEGEVVWNDYVFSNRIKVPNSVREQYNLKGKDNMTFAEAVKRAQEASAERPNDPIEQRGLDALLTNLMQEQEIIRNKKAEREQHAQSEDLAAMFADGGSIHIAKNKKGTFTAAATKHGMGVQEFAGHVLANKDKYSPAMVKKANFARNASKWNHAMGGHLFPLGGHFDLNTGVWIPEVIIPSFKVDNTYKAPEYQFDEANPDFSVPEANQAFRLNQFWQPPMKLNFKSGVTPSGGGQEAPTTTTITSLPTSGWQTSLRYAPILGPAIGLAHTLFNKPDYEYANELEAAAEQYAGRAHHVAPTMLGDYLAYNPFDRLFYANELGAQQAATRRAIMNSSNGNAGQAMAALLAAGYNDNIGLGKLFREGEEYNLAQRQKVAEFNRGTNQFNAETDLRSQMFNAEQDRAIAAMLLGAKERSLAMKQADDQAYQTALMANLSGLFDNIGALGEDYANKYDRNMLINSGVFGTLSQKPQGVSDKDWEAYLRIVGRPYAKGGKINKRKKGLTI